MTRIYAKHWKPSKTLIVLFVDLILIGTTLSYVVFKQQQTTIKTVFVCSVAEQQRNWKTFGPLSDALQIKKRLTCPL